MALYLAALLMCGYFGCMEYYSMLCDIERCCMAWFGVVWQGCFYFQKAATMLFVMPRNASTVDNLLCPPFAKSNGHRALKLLL